MLPLRWSKQNRINAWEERRNPSAGYLFHKAGPWQAVSRGQRLSGFLLPKQAVICAAQVAAFSLPRAGAAPVVSAGWDSAGIS